MTLPERIERKIEKSGNCWTWSAAKTGEGYGGVWLNGRMVLAHRAVFEALEGPIPDGMTLDHLCRNRACVNPQHLEVVTRGANVLRGVGVTAMQARQETCVRGHLFSHRDTNGKRACRTCLAAASRRYVARKDGVR